jgi:parvulin-like peptidyl-prolyl isomerase
LQPGLSERAGREIVREVVLDRMLEAEAQRLGIAVSGEDIAREADLLRDTLGAQGRGAMAGVRTRLGLGPTRMNGLLRRNALLRALSEPDPIGASDVDLEVLLRYGERVRARLIVTATEREASEARAAARSDPSGVIAGFTRQATLRSLDPTAAVGGSLGEISPSDPAFPAIVSESLARLGDREMSPVLGIDGGFAVVLVEQRIAARLEPVSVEERDAVRAELVARNERRAMGELAQRLVRSADVAVLHESLIWSWRAGNP